MDSVRELIDLAFDARENPEQGVTTRDGNRWEEGRKLHVD